jgi:hypothetical protein
MNRVYLGDEPLIAFKTISCLLDFYFLSFSFFGIIAKRWPKKVAPFFVMGTTHPLTNISRGYSVSFANCSERLSIPSGKIRGPWQYW